MNKTFRTLLGAAILVAGGTVTAQAANTYYTWELSNLHFGPVMTYDDYHNAGWDDGLVVHQYTPDGGSASGSLVLKYNGSSWTLSSVSITTVGGGTPGLVGTTYSTTYTGALNPGVNALFVTDTTDQYQFELNWAPNIMTSNIIGGLLNPGKHFDLDWVASYESQTSSNTGTPCSEDDSPGCLTFYTRASGTYFDPDTQAPFGTPGTWTLRTVTTDTAVPEPATMALFGTGLLGLAALRRRRAS